MQPEPESARPPQPHRIPFDLQSNEQVLLFCRRHWAFLAWQLTKHVVVLMVPPVLLLLVVAKASGLDGRAGQVTWALAGVWAAFWLVKTYFAWYRYNHDIWVVTNQRIVDSVRRHWFHHRIASADLVDVEDIAVKKEGLFATLFGFGNLQLQTAGEQPNFILSGIPQPQEVLALVDSQRDIARRELGRLGGPETA